MALSMIQFSYKSEAADKLIQKPEDRSISVKRLIEKLGGRLIGFYYCFGEYDGIALVDMPDTKSLLAASMVSFAGGATSKIKTTPLISVKDAMAAMKKSAGLRLPQPKGK
jgi:uncharacterized protein with GYD domain